MTKAFKLIEKVGIDKVLNQKIKLLKKAKFEFILNKFVDALDKIVIRNYRSGFSFISLILAVPTHGNSRLNMIKRLKGKIIVEALKIEAENSRTIRSKDKYSPNNSRLDFKAPRQKQSIKKMGSFLVEKENGFNRKSLEEENRILELSIKQTENYLLKTIDEMTKEIQLKLKNRLNEAADKEKELTSQE